MKSIKNGVNVKRVSDKEAMELVNKSNWEYISKTEWKKTRPEKTKKKNK